MTQTSEATAPTFFLVTNRGVIHCTADAPTAVHGEGAPGCVKSGRKVAGWIRAEDRAPKSWERFCPKCFPGR